MPAKRIVILEKEGPVQFRYLMWADVPVARQTFYANANATSAWKGATQSDVDALKAGQVVERTERISKPGATLPQIQAELEATWQVFQDEITNANPWVRYGSFWSDQSVWTAGGVT